ncbi:hypothetical protein ACFL6S_26950 [Candidatus Poribacteria bacterium]
MRRFCSLICSVLLITGLLTLSTDALAQVPQTNIRMNFGIWDMPDKDVGISVTHTDLGRNERFTNVEVSGISGAFAFSHMISPRFAWELSVGGFTDTETEALQEVVDSRYFDDHYETIYSFTHAVSVSYITMGLIYYPMYELQDSLGGVDSFLRPYLTAGIGPYFGWDSRWDDDDLTDADFVSTMGAYPGIGLDVLLSRHFIFNVDLRYHLVEFGEPLKGTEDFSGLNVMAGFKVAF